MDETRAMDQNHELLTMRPIESCNSAVALGLPILALRRKQSCLRHIHSESHLSHK